MPFTSRARLASWAVEQSVKHYLAANPEATISQVKSDAEGTLALAGLKMTQRNVDEVLDYVRIYGPSCCCGDLRQSAPSVVDSMKRSKK